MSSVKAKIVHKLQALPAPPKRPTKLDMDALLREREQARLDAFLKLEDIYEEIDELDRECEPLNDSLVDSHNPQRAAFYKARLRAICDRERVLLPELRAAAIEFRAADLGVIAASGTPAEYLTHEKKALADFDRKNETSQVVDYFKRKIAVDANPLLKAGFDWEYVNAQAEGYLKSLSEAYPELA